MPPRSSRLVELTTVRVVFWGLLGLLSPGCAIVEEVHGDGATSRTIALAAPINVLPPSPGQGRVVRMTGVGIAIFDEALTLGYFNNSQIAPDPACQIVLVGNTDEELRHFATLIGHARSVCGDNITSGDIR